jgi:hypothetical protein
MKITHEFVQKVQDEMERVIWEVAAFFEVKDRIYRLDNVLASDLQVKANFRGNGWHDAQVKLTYRIAGGVVGNYVFNYRIYPVKEKYEKADLLLVSGYIRRQATVILLREEFFNEYMEQRWLPKHRI